jgi:hypothetical protein
MTSDVRRMLGGLLNLATWRSYLADRQARAFDRRFGTDTRAKVAVADMADVDGELAQHAVHYEASAMPKFRRALAVVRRHLGRTMSDYSFVDYGSGKGLVVMLASRLPFRAVYGVEMSPSLHAAAQCNVRKFAERAGTLAPIHLSCADALRFALPEGNVVAYLYNPFDRAFTAKFVGGLMAGLPDSARRVLVVYVNAVHKDVFEGSGRFRRMFEDRTLSVYELAAAASGHPS